MKKSVLKESGARPFSLRSKQQERQANDLAALYQGIAKKHLGVESLKEQGVDRLDFHEVSVSAIRDALRAAYYAGRAATASGVAKTSKAPCAEAVAALKAAKEHGYAFYGTIRETTGGDVDSLYFAAWDLIRDFFREKNPKAVEAFLLSRIARHLADEISYIFKSGPATPEELTAALRLAIPRYRRDYREIRAEALSGRA